MDFDSDSDGTANCIDECDNDIDKVEEGVCGCNNPDDDSDGDVTGNAELGLPAFGDAGYDCVDECDDDPLKTAPGIWLYRTPIPIVTRRQIANNAITIPSRQTVFGCGTPDTDSDNDRFTFGDDGYDCNDGCPNNPGKVHRAHVAATPILIPMAMLPVTRGSTFPLVATPATV